MRCAGTINPNARIMAKIESEFRHLIDYRKSQSLLKKYLTEKLFNTIKSRVTSFGSTLLDVILSGVENIDSKIGVYVPDAEAYTVFSELFDQIINDYHSQDYHTKIEYGFLDDIINVDIEKKFMLSIKISCNRSLCGFPFNRQLTEDQFKHIETRVSRDLLRLENVFKGMYHSFVGMPNKLQNEMIAKHYLLQNRDDEFLDEIIGNKCWPVGRGVFFNKKKKFWVWLNIEDHLCIISVSHGGNLRSCYARYVMGLRKIEHFVGLKYDKRLGFLNYCPTNLGTGMEVAGQLMLYKLPKHKLILNKIADRYKVFIDVACSEKCSAFTCTVVFKPKLGMNEFQTVKWMQDALLDIIRTKNKMKLDLKSKCRQYCACRIKPTARIMAKIESEFRHIADYKKSRSLLKKYLTEDMFNLIKYRITPFGSTLLEVILLGVENIDSLVGIYAPDGEAYFVFSEIFDPIINEYHGKSIHPATEYGFTEKIFNIDLENKHVISIKISCNRSLCGYPFNPKLTEEEFKQIEIRVSQDLLRMDDYFEGDYQSLININENKRWHMIKENYRSYKKSDRFLKEVIGFRSWPHGRGVFNNFYRNLYIWINIEDHLQIISLENSPDFRACYQRFVTVVKKVGNLVGFLHDKKLGYLNLCPTHLGTGMEISAKIKLKKLPKHRQVLENIVNKFDLHIEVSCIDLCAAYICIVTYIPKIGMNEFQAVKWMQDAVLHIIRTEFHI